MLDVHNSHSIFEKHKISPGDTWNTLQNKLQIYFFEKVLLRRVGCHGTLKDSVWLLTLVSFLRLPFHVIVIVVNYVMFFVLCIIASHFTVCEVNLNFYEMNVYKNSQIAKQKSRILRSPFHAIIWRLCNDFLMR